MEKTLIIIGVIILVVVIVYFAREHAKEKTKSDIKSDNKAKAADINKDILAGNKDSALSKIDAYFA